MESDNHSKMPTPIKDYIRKLIVTGVVSAIAIIITAIVFQSHGLLLLLLFTVYFAYLVYDIKHKWRKNLIKQIPAVCTAVRSDFLTNKTVLHFESKTDDDAENTEQVEKKHLKFVLANRRKARDYSSGQAYILYVAENAPHYLIGAEVFSQ